MKEKISIAAFLCYLDKDNNLFEKAIASKSFQCFSLDYAVNQVVNCKMVVVAKANMEKFRELVKGATDGHERVVDNKKSPHD